MGACACAIGFDINSQITEITEDYNFKVLQELFKANFLPEHWPEMVPMQVLQNVAQVGECTMVGHARCDMLMWHAATCSEAGWWPWQRQSMACCGKAYYAPDHFVMAHVPLLTHS
jgi:hypothetical protein